MIPVSTAWQQAIREQFRYQGYLEVVLQVTPPGLQENLAVATSTSEYVASTSKLTDENPNLPTPYITLEKGRWRLNKQYVAVQPGKVVDDWWSTPMTDGRKELDFTFDQPYDIPGIYIEWDVLNGSYPTQLLVDGYGNDGTKKYSFDVTDITSATGFINAPMDKVKRVVLTIVSWSRETWRARINEILFGLYVKYDSINNGRVISGSSVDYSHPLSSELPVHTMDIELRNLDKTFDPSLKTGIAKYFAERQLVKYRWGFTTSLGVVEWTPQLSYYMKEFKIPSDSKNVSLSSTSRLDFLTSQLNTLEYDATDRTLYDLALAVLQQSSIIKTSMDEEPWELSEGLKQFKTNAPVPSEAINTILQYIANAAVMQLSINPTSGFVRISSFSATPVQSVDKVQELGDPEITVQERLHTISIGVTAYAKDTSAEKTSVGTGEYKLSGRVTLTVQYSCEYAVDVTCSVSGATLVSFTPYASSATVVIDAGDTEVDVVVSLSGHVVTKNTTFIETYRDTSIDSGLDVVVENPFVTNIDFLQPITDKLVEWYNLPQQQKINYTGYPELTAGDSIALTTDYDSLNAQVVKATLDFDGGFSGTLGVR